MSAHTEGPWFCKFDDFDEELHITSAVLEASNMVEICRVGVGFDQPFEAEQQANARLIAAAPEMAAALAPFSDYAGALFTRNRNASEVAFSIVTHDGKHIDIKVGDFFAARSAIAKAEGRS
jgi:hypothetical protein